MKLFNAHDWQTDVLKNLGVRLSAREIQTRSAGKVHVPLTTPFNFARSREYERSPRAISLSRKLENALLQRLKNTGIFSEGNWLDIAGSKSYGEWLNVPAGRYKVLNLPGVPDAAITGDFDRPETLDFSKSYDGILSLNAFYMSQNPEQTIRHVMRFLKPEGFAVLEFSSHHYWYVGEDGNHWANFNPLLISFLLTPHLESFLIVPVGNCFQACVDYYARRSRLRYFGLNSFIRNVGLRIGSLDRSPMSAMNYMAIGRKKSIGEEPKNKTCF